MQCCEAAGSSVALTLRLAQLLRYSWVRGSGFSCSIYFLYSGEGVEEFLQNVGRAIQRTAQGQPLRSGSQAPYQFD